MVAVLVVLALGVAAGSLAGIDGTGAGAHDAPPASTTDLPQSASAGPGGPQPPTGGGMGQDTYLRFLLVLGVGAIAVAYAAVPSRRRAIGLTGVALGVAVAGFVAYRPDATVRVPTLGTSPVSGAAGVVALAGVLAAGWYVFRGGDGPAVAAPSSDAGQSPDTDTTTGRPHPADLPATDPVTRAWQQMVGDLDLPRPASRTPGEFARAAIDAGRDAAAVRQLTRLYEQVRYGGADPTDHAETAADLASTAEAER